MSYPLRKNSMLRSHLIARIAQRFGDMTNADVTLSVEVILAAIACRLSAGEPSEIRRFGTFTVYVRPPRMGRNPANGAIVHVRAKHIVRFKPATELRSRVGGAGSR